MAYDLEEQERIDALRDWWEKNRWYIIGAITLVLLAVGGQQGYQYLRTQAAEKASAALADVETAAKDKDAKKSNELAAALRSAHPKTFAATQASLIAARVAFEANDLAAAEQHLNWVVGQGEASLRPVARLRLAAVYLDQKKYDEAMRMLDGVNDVAYAALVSDLKGDVLLAQGRRDEARAAYKRAFEVAGERSALRGAVQVKLDSLGGA